MVRKKYQFEDLQQASKGQLPEDIEEDDDLVHLILRHYTIAEDYIDQLIKINKNNTSDNDPRLKQWINYEEPPYTKAEYLRFLKECRTASGKEWIQPSHIASRGQVDESFLDMQKHYPISELIKLVRIQTTNKKEYVLRTLKIQGLTSEGTTKHVILDQCDFWTKPAVKWKLVSIDPDAGKNDIYAKKVQVATAFWSPYDNGELGGTMFLEPFEVEKVKKWLEAEPLFNPESGRYYALAIHRASDNRTFAVNSIDDFLQPTFSDVIEAIKKRELRSSTIAPLLNRQYG